MSKDIKENRNLLLIHTAAPAHKEYWAVCEAGAAVHVHTPQNHPPTAQLALTPEEAIRNLRMLLRPAEGWMVARVHSSALALLKGWHAEWAPRGDEADGPADMAEIFSQLEKMAGKSSAEEEQIERNAAQRALAGLREHGSGALQPSGEYYFYGRNIEHEKFDGYASTRDAHEGMARLMERGYGDFSPVYQYHTDEQGLTCNDPRDND